MIGVTELPGCQVAVVHRDKPRARQATVQPGNPATS